MEFGRLPFGEKPENINFTLAPDPDFNLKVLSGKKNKKAKGYVGCPKWGRKEWVGKIYPFKTKEKDFLANYVKHYNCIELNATHYKLYDVDVLKKWVDKAFGHDFLFCPKMFQDVTHFGSLRGKEFVTKQFLDNITFLRPHLGPIYIQMSESFAPKRKSELYDFLKWLPSDFQFFLEVRYPEWFSDESIWQELIQLLKELNIGLVITDTPGRRDCVHMHLAIPKTMIRFVANDFNDIDLKRIDDWAERIKYWIDNGLQEFYFIVHIHDEAVSPEFTIEVIDRLNKKCGLNIKKPVLMEQQKGLFD